VAVLAISTVIFYAFKAAKHAAAAARASAGMSWECDIFHNEYRGTRPRK
jgi:hypothetical protein